MGDGGGIFRERAARPKAESTAGGGDGPVTDGTHSELGAIARSNLHVGSSLRPLVPVLF